MIVIKKWTALLLAGVLLLLPAACGDGEARSAQSAAPPSSFSAAAPSLSAASPTGAQAPAPHQLAPLTDSGANVLTGAARAEGAEGLRPAAVMVSNSFRARPQRGLHVADVLVEMLGKGGATHFIALYDDYRGISTTGPVSETYDQLVQFALPLNAVQVHAGASPYARNLLAATGTATVNGMTLGELAFGFDTPRTMPRPGGKLNQYSWFTDGALVTAGMNALGIPPTGELAPLFRFGQNALAAGEEAAYITAVYSDESKCDFNYDVNSNLYYKYVDGAFHTDEDGNHLTFTNLMFLSAGVAPKADSGQYWEVDFSGGTGWYFSQGRMVPILWQKGGPSDALRVTDAEGREVDVNVGKSYIGFLPASRPDALAWRPLNAA